MGRDRIRRIFLLAVDSLPVVRITSGVQGLSMNFLSSIFSGAGSAVFGDAVNSAENYATAAFSIIAGELLILILLVIAILVWGVAIG